MNEIYKSHSPALSGFVRLYLANPNDVADIVHDTMLEVWRKADRFQGRSSLKTWIFSIAKNKAIDRAELLAISQNAESVQNAISQLKPDHRRAIHLSFFEDLTYKEIAEIEGCPEGTIKTRILYEKITFQFEPFHLVNRHISVKT